MRASLHPPAARPSSRGIAPPRRIVQCKVGFEFETSWLILAPNRAVGPDDPIIEGRGWHMVPDRTARSVVKEVRKDGIYPRGNVEFVTDAFEETEAGQRGLEAALEEIGSTIDALTFRQVDPVAIEQAVRGTVGWGSYLRTEGRALRDKVLVQRGHGPLIAKPQMTAGIKLEYVYTALNEMARPRGDLAENLHVTSGTFRADPATYQEIHSRARARAMERQAAATGPDLPSGSYRAQVYEGVLALLGTYLYLAGTRRDLPYDKALVPLLSRTDLGKLPEWARGNNLALDAMYVSTRFLGTTDDDMFAHVFDQLFVDPERNSHLTVLSWLNGISAGRDPLSWGQDRSARWNPQAVGSPDDRGVGHVFEFRGMAGGLPHDQWRRFALTHFEYVKGLNSGAIASPVSSAIDPAPIDPYGLYARFRI